MSVSNFWTLEPVNFKKTSKIELNEKCFTHSIPQKLNWMKSVSHTVYQPKRKVFHTQYINLIKYVYSILTDIYIFTVYQVPYQWWGRCWPVPGLRTRCSWVRSVWRPSRRRRIWCLPPHTTGGNTTSPSAPRQCRYSTGTWRTQPVIQW